MTDTRTIRITGKGNLKVHPDMTRITITLNGLDKEYSKALQHSAEDTKTLAKSLKTLGFQRKDLKTLKFSVDTEYEDYTEKDLYKTNYKRRLIGYSFTHKVKIEFESDNKRLGKILYTLANMTLRPEFTLSYTVKDTEAVKNMLLGNAVKDAKTKAQVLTDAAEVKLGRMVSIDYSWQEVNFEMMPSNHSMFYSKATVSDGSFDVDIEPDDIDVSDTVTIVWEIC